MYSYFYALAVMVEVNESIGDTQFTNTQIKIKQCDGVVTVPEPITAGTYPMVRANFEESCKAQFPNMINFSVETLNLLQVEFES